MDEDSSSYNHQCYICDKIFSANSNLNRHLRKIHKENVQSPYNNVKCALCDSVFSSSCIYNSHLEQEHQIKIEIERLTFQSKESFEEWKHDVENETTSQFIKSRGEKKTKNVNKTYFSCNRSGYYVSKARTRKALKKQGSRKINGRCPASMNVTMNPDSSYDVRFIKTHVGHDFELRHLDLSEKDRDLIVQKLTSGVTKKDIIRQIRSTAAEQQHQMQSNSSMSPASSVSGGTSGGLGSSTSNIKPITIGASNVSGSGDQIVVIPASSSEIVITTTTTTTASSSNNNINNINSATSSNATTPIPSSNTINHNGKTFNISSSSIGQQQRMSRLHLATTKDLHNILNSKHLDPKKIRHNYDLNNVEAWISEMKEYNEESSVLFYKSQNELSERFPTLRQDDFMLVIMNHGQARVLKEYGDKCIVIDSTHNVHCEYLQVAYMSVIDDDRRGFPVAFMFSTRTDAEILEVFFSLLKERVGTITTRMFIADELLDFIQAWMRVMSMPVNNMLTPWNVFDSWSKKFHLVKGRDKLRKLKKQLRTLLTEAEEDKFSRSLKQILTDYKNDPDACQFIDYFEVNFLKERNPDVWSSCLRKSYVSNFQLLGLHDKFKASYKEGKSSKKLCQYITCLMSLYEDYQLEKLSKYENERPSKRDSLIKRHRKSVETVQMIYEVALKPTYWLCPSESSSEPYYEVRQARTNYEEIPQLEESGQGHDLDQNNVDGGDTNKSGVNSLPASKRIKTEENELHVNKDQLEDDGHGQVSHHPQGGATTLVDSDPDQACCDLKCPDCSACRHEYKCTCLDYIVNMNMCKHIHRTVSMCKPILPLMDQQKAADN